MNGRLMTRNGSSFEKDELIVHVVIDKQTVAADNYCELIRKGLMIGLVRCGRSYPSDL